MRDIFVSLAAGLLAAGPVHFICGALGVDGSPRLWIVVGCATGAYLLVDHLMEKRAAARGGFIDILKHPERMPSADDLLEWRIAKRRMRNAGRGMAESEFPAVVEAWLDPSTISELVLETLKGGGVRAVPALKAVAGDPRLRRPGDGRSNDLPLLEAAELLKEHDRPAAAAMLRLHLKELDGMGKYWAICKLVEILPAGEEEEIIRRLSDGDEEIREAALNGLLHRLREEPAGETAATLLYDHLLPWVDGKWPYFVGGTLPELLIALDRPRAVALFLSLPPCWADAQHASQIVAAMEQDAARLPASALLDLSEHLEKAKNPSGGRICAVLAPLPADDPAVAARWDHLCRHPDPEIAASAVECRLKQSGVDPDALAYAAHESTAPDVELLRDFFAMRFVDREVCNGGFSQYFLNSSGDEWPRAQKALALVGHPEANAIFSEALRRFGPDGPATDRGARTKALSKIIRKDERAFGDLDSRYYACKRQLHCDWLNWCLANADTLRGLAGRLPSGKKA